MSPRSRVAIGGSWLTTAVYIGPGTGWLPTLALTGTVLCAIPWWTSHRRREKVRVERILADWPDIADASGLTGTRPVSALVDVAEVRIRELQVRTYVDGPSLD